MINPQTGFAPSEWQITNPGNILVARADKGPLAVATLRAIVDYIHEILLSTEEWSQGCQSIL